MDIDKKSLFHLPRPSRAEIMPEPVWSSDVMVGNMPETGKNGKRTTHQRLWGGTGYSPAGPKPLTDGPVAGKRSTGPAAGGQAFA